MGPGTWLSALRAARVAGEQRPHRGDRSRHGEPRTAPSGAEGAGRRDLHAYFSAGNRTTDTTGSGRGGGISRFSGRLPRSWQSRAAQMRRGHRGAALFVQSPAATPYRLALSRRYQQMRRAQRLRGQSPASHRVEPVPRRGSAHPLPSGQHQPPAGRTVRRVPPHLGGLEPLGAPRARRFLRAITSHATLGTLSLCLLVLAPVRNLRAWHSFSLQSLRVRGAVKQTQTPSYLNFSSLDRKCT